jgi:Na+/melibiose symporter-like transporter
MQRGNGAGDGPAPARAPVARYAAAHAGKTLFWAASDIYFGFYLTEVCGIAPSVMGVLLAASYLINAASDWILGRRLARSVRTARGAGLLQFVGAALCSATLLLFGCVALVTPDARILTCIVALVIFRVAYSLYDIPQNSLLALAGGDDRDRGRLTAARILFGGLARIALSAAFVPLFVRQSITAQIDAFLILSGITAALGMATAAMLARRLDRDDPIAAVVGRPLQPRRHRPRAALHWVMLILSAGTTIFSQLEPYLAAYAIQSRIQAGAMLIAVAAGSSLSQPLWMILADRYGRWRGGAAALTVAAIGALLFPFLVLRGLVPAIISGTLYGIGVGGMFFLLWTGIARQAAHDHGVVGATATLGAFSGFAKLGQASAILAVGLYLDHVRTAVAVMPGQPLLALMTGAVLVALILSCLIAIRQRTSLA